MNPSLNFRRTIQVTVEDHGTEAVHAGTTLVQRHGGIGTRWKRWIRAQGKAQTASIAVAIARICNAAMGAKARFHVSIFPCCCTSAHDVAIAGFDGLSGLARLGLHCLGTVRARSAPCGYRPAAAVGRSSTAGVVAGALTSSTPVTCPQRLPILLPQPPLRAALCVQPGGLLDDQFVGRALLHGVAAQGGARLPQHFLLMAAAAAGRRVSIRARHCWRAMPCVRVSTTALLMFQSAPAIAGGRCLRRVPHTSCRGSFQSAPAIAGGRC